MSENRENVEILEEEVVVNATDLAECEMVGRKPKMSNKVKKGLKVAGIAAIGGLLGFALGKKSSSKYENYESDTIDENVEE